MWPWRNVFYSKPLSRQLRGRSRRSKNNKLTTWPNHVTQTRRKVLHSCGGLWRGNCRLQTSSTSSRRRTIALQSSASQATHRSGMRPWILRRHSESCNKTIVLGLFHIAAVQIDPTEFPVYLGLYILAGLHTSASCPHVWQLGQRASYMTPHQWASHCYASVYTHTLILGWTTATLYWLKYCKH